MEAFDRKNHWEKIYQTKQLEEVSWYEPQPINSVELIEKTAASKDSAVIDVGGGDSFLIDNLLEKGYTNLTLLDISEAAVERAKKRLGPKADLVKWVIADASEFIPPEKYDVWHDRAAFHFLTQADEIFRYKQLVKNGLTHGGTLIIGTFSEQGPKRCSGIEIRQYSEESLVKTFADDFTKTECKKINHTTPSNTVQNFVFCVLKKS